MGAEVSKAMTISPVRRVLASGAMIASGAVLGAIALHDLRWIEWSLLAFSGGVAAAGIGLARKSMVSQVLSRAMGWLVFVPSLLVALVTSFGDKHPEPVSIALAALTGAALLLARPMLHTQEARAQFEPTSFRRWLFASATASATAGITAGVFAFDALRWNDFRLQAFGVGMMGVSLLGSALGVVRMRAWGMLLGAATSIFSLIAALVARDASSIAWMMAAVPGLMMTLPMLLAARSRARAERERASRVRVADDTENEYVLTRYRIADDRAELDEETGEAAPKAARAARIA